MPRSKERIGSGITARTVAVVSGPFGAEDIEYLQITLAKKFEDLHPGKIEVWANNVLAEEGIALGNTGGPGEAPTPPMKSGREVMIGDGIPHDSKAAYALEILLGLMEIREAIAAGDADEAATAAFTLGEIAREARMKFEWEPDALRGQKNAARLRDSSQVANIRRQSSRAVEHAKWRRVAETIKRERPALTSATALAHAVKSRLSLPESIATIRKKLAGLT